MAKRRQQRAESKEIQDMLDQARRLAEFKLNPKAAVRLYLAQQSAREMQDYLQRGRRHEKLAADALQEQLVDSFRWWAANPRGRAEIAAIDDLLSEYDLRGIEFPSAAVEPYYEVVQQTAKAVFAARNEEDKEALGAAIMDCWMAAGARQ